MKSQNAGKFLQTCQYNHCQQLYKMTNYGSSQVLTSGIIKKIVQQSLWEGIAEKNIEKMVPQTSKEGSLKLANFCLLLANKVHQRLSTQQIPKIQDFGPKIKQHRRRKNVPLYWKTQSSAEKNEMNRTILSKLRSTNLTINSISSLSKQKKIQIEGQNLNRFNSLVYLQNQQVDKFSTIPDPFEQKMRKAKIDHKLQLQKSNQKKKHMLELSEERSKNLKRKFNQIKTHSYDYDGNFMKVDGNRSIKNRQTIIALKAKIPNSYTSVKRETRNLSNTSLIIINKSKMLKRQFTYASQMQRSVDNFDFFNNKSGLQMQKGVKIITDNRKDRGETHNNHSSDKYAEEFKQSTKVNTLQKDISLRQTAKSIGMYENNVFIQDISGRSSHFSLKQATLKEQSSHLKSKISYLSKTMIQIPNRARYEQLLRV